MDHAQRTKTRFWGQWGFAVVASVLGLLLVVAMTTSYFAAKRMVPDIDRGQMDGVHRALGERVESLARLPLEDELQAVAKELEGMGLRYVALIGPQMQVVSDSGASKFPKPLKSGPGLRFAEGRVAEIKMVYLRPAPGQAPRQNQGAGPGPFAPEALGGPPRSPAGRPPPSPEMKARMDRGEFVPPELGGPGPKPQDRRPPLYFIEIEPTLSQAVLNRARRDLGIGVAVALALLFTSFIFGRLAQRSERLRDELLAQRELAAVGEMSAVLAHELRNPLTSLKGNAELLVESLPEGLQRKQATRVYEAAGRLERLTEDLLDFVRAGRITARDEAPVPMAERAVVQSGVEVQLDVSEAPRVWPLDTDRVEQALVNLLRNASQASEGQRVDLVVKRKGDWLCLCVRDRGPGVPEEQREDIFAPFVTSRTRGTGLGLAVVRRVAELHGGRVFITDNPGGGAQFILELPLDRSQRRAVEPTQREGRS